jgi:hypothetical protein
VPDVVVRVPFDFSVRQAGSVTPVPKAHVNGGIPPLACKLTEYAVPTAPAILALVDVTEGAAGIVIVVVPVLLESATEVAVIVAVCDELVAAGAVKVAEVVVWFDSVPGPLKLQLTPAAL